MKKIMVAALITLAGFSANAGTLKLCAVKANAICEELEGKDFQECHRTQMQFCMEDLYNKTWTPYGETCEERCLVLPDSQVEMCMHECLHMI